MATTFFAVMGLTLGVMLSIWMGLRLVAQFRLRDGLNSTESWTPALSIERKTPTAVALAPYDREIISAHLEDGESLVGFTRGFFVPARAQDYKFGSGIEKLPLLIAATTQRILLFEVTLLKVHRTCFVSYDRIASMSPPKPGLWGTSGKMRITLQDGRTYQFGFLGPLLNTEAMRLEQSMAEQFRRVAARRGAGDAGPVAWREAA